MLGRCGISLFDLCPRSFLHASSPLPRVTKTTDLAFWLRVHSKTARSGAARSSRESSNRAAVSEYKHRRDQTQLQDGDRIAFVRLIAGEDDRVQVFVANSGEARPSSAHVEIDAPDHPVTRSFSESVSVFASGETELRSVRSSWSDTPTPEMCQLLVRATEWAATGQVTEGPCIPNHLTRWEEQAGWRKLFDGETLAGWHAFGKDAPPEKGWRVAGGAMVHDAAAGGGDLVSDARFTDFELEFEFQLAKGANSGVKSRFAESGSGPVGPEFQLLDEGAEGSDDPKTRIGALYGLYPSEGQLRPAGRWNEARIVVRGASIEHWLNGERVVRADMTSDDWHARVASSKFRDVADFRAHHPRPHRAAGPRRRRALSQPARARPRRTGRPSGRNLRWRDARRLEGAGRRALQRRGRRHPGPDRRRWTELPRHREGVQRLHPGDGAEDRAAGQLRCADPQPRARRRPVVRLSDRDRPVRTRLVRRSVRRGPPRLAAEPGKQRSRPPGLPPRRMEPLPHRVRRSHDQGLGQRRTDDQLGRRHGRQRNHRTAGAQRRQHARALARARALGPVGRVRPAEHVVRQSSDTAHLSSPSSTRVQGRERSSKRSRDARTACASIGSAACPHSRRT